MIKTTVHDPLTCPECGKDLDNSTCIEGDVSPSPNDLTVCWKCGAYLQYGEGLTLRPLDQKLWTILPRKTKERLVMVSMLAKKHHGIEGA